MSTTTNLTQQQVHAIQLISHRENILALLIVLMIFALIYLLVNHESRSDRS